MQNIVGASLSKYRQTLNLPAFNGAWKVKVIDDSHWSEVLKQTFKLLQCMGTSRVSLVYMKADSINHQVYLFLEFWGDIHWEGGTIHTGPWSGLRNLLIAKLQRLNFKKKTLTMKLNKCATCMVVFSFAQYYFAVMLLSLAWHCCATLSPIPCTVSSMLQLPSSCDIIMRVGLLCTLCKWFCLHNVSGLFCINWELIIFMESCWQETDTFKVH